MRWRALLCVLTLVTVACGNRLSEEEILAQNTVGGESSSQRADQFGQGVEGGTDGAAAGDEGGLGSAGGAEGGPGSSAGQGGGTGGTGSSGGVSGAQGAGSGSVSGEKAPIIIGFVGWLSGIGGPTLGPARDSWVAWTKMVNAKGGINGHPVQLLVGDDSGNNSRSVAIVRDFVENKGAIAISWFSAGVDGVANYAKSKSVPVVGAGVTEKPWSENPMLFPPVPGVDGRFWGLARLAKNAGATKIGLLSCVESVTCEQSADAFKGFAKEEGLEVVYEAGVSLTQPDYTAECLQMRNAGVEAVVPIVTFDAEVRMAQSCDRQDYRPIWDSPVGTDAMAEIPELEGTLYASSSFPWFLRSGSPGVDEYVQALQRYAPNRLSEGTDFQAWGWLSAKMFEKAAANVSDEPTSQDILNGLWAMKGETFGGLAPGGMARTFTQGRPTPDTLCTFEVRLEDGEWVAPKGLTPVCR